MTVPVPATPVGVAVRELFSRLVERLGLRQTLEVYLAGGMAVYFYVGERVSHDLHAELGTRVLLPSDLAVEIEGEEPVYFDTNFNPMFALVHENYQRDAVPVELGVDHIDLRLLSPVDLAVSKIARFADVDREDLSSLVQAGLTDAAAIAQRAREAVTAYIDNPADIRHKIELAIELAVRLGRARHLGNFRSPLGWIATSPAARARAPAPASLQCLELWPGCGLIQRTFLRIM